jgi:hypothetical protein
MTRVRDRLAAVGADLPTIAAPLAAGAMTAVLTAMPGGAATPAMVAAVGRPPAAVAAPALLAPPTIDAGAADVPPAPPAPRRGHFADGRGLRPTTAQDAQAESSSMPLNLALADTGIGVDPAPVVDAALTPASGRTQP